MRLYGFVCSLVMYVGVLVVVVVACAFRCCSVVGVNYVLCPLVLWVVGWDM